MNRQDTARDISITALTAFLNFLGLTLAIPILTPLCLDKTGGILPAGSTDIMRTIVLGMILGIYPLVQFFTAPLLGSLSDHWGRKKVLMISSVINIAGYALMAVSIIINNLPLVFTARIISGAASGSLAVLQSSLSDLSDAQTKARNFGIFGAAFGASFFIGPALGGFLSDPRLVSWFDYSTPFWLAAVLSVISLLQIAFLFTETLPADRRRPVDLHPMSGFINVGKALVNPSMRRVFLSIFFLGFGFNFFSQFFQVYLIKVFNTTRPQIGILFSYIGIFSILAQTVLVRPLSRRFTPAQIVTTGLLLLALAFPLILLAPSLAWLYLIIPLIPIFNGSTMPNMTTIVSGLAGESEQGEILGINQSVQAVSQFIPPIIGGFVVGYHASLPLWIAFGTILIAWFLILGCRKKACTH